MRDEALLNGIDAARDMNDDLDCAVAMLQGLKAGKTPAKIRKLLLKEGYTPKQIAAASDVLIKST
jgi:hypothetical protein